MTAVPEARTPAWAHAAGVLDLQPLAQVPSDPLSIADRLMVQETASRYCLAYDERRMNVLESVMTDYVTFAYRFSQGPVHKYSGRTKVLDWLAQVMQSQPDQRRHLVGSLLVERLTPNEATVVTHTAIYGVEQTARLVTTGIYIFQMIKRDSRWLIDNTLVALDRPF